MHEETVKQAHQFNNETAKSFYVTPVSRKCGIDRVIIE